MAKIVTSKTGFSFVHKENESYNVGAEPILMSDEAYEHLVQTYGTEWFTAEDVADAEVLPKADITSDTPAVIGEEVLPIVKPKGRGRKKVTE